jgi:uncharacterized membrane protein SpoIIM required for sporulation/uncharacterized RDD family membrane protein YckC
VPPNVSSIAQRRTDWLEPPVLAIESATGVDVRLPIAGPGARAFAFMIDWVMRLSLSGAWFLLSAWLFTGDFSFRVPDDSETAWFLLVVLPPSAIFFLYHLILEAALSGRTPGKRIAGLRVIALDGGAPSLGAILLRNVFRLVDSLPFLYSVGLATVMVSREHRRIGDFAAGTLVVYDRGATRNAQRATTVPAVLAKIDEYRVAARQAAQARSTAEPLALAEIEARYGQLHTTVYQHAHMPLWLLRSLFRDQIPDALRAMRGHLLWVSLWFLLSALAGAWLVAEYPDLIQLFASQEMIATVERGELWTDGLLNVAPSSVLSIEILTNNIVVALFTFVAGFLFGLGTLYIVGTNGLMLGAVFAFTASHGLDHRLFEFVVAHGCVELSCICIAGAAGAYTGEALARPGATKRSSAFATACASGGKVLLAVTVLLLVCGFIEGYISPDPEIPLVARVVIGCGYFLLMIGFLRGDLFGRSRYAAPIPI